MAVGAGIIGVGEIPGFYENPFGGRNIPERGIPRHRGPDYERQVELFERNLASITEQHAQRTGGVERE